MSEQRPAPPALAVPNLADAIRIHAADQPDALALVAVGDGRRTLSWADLDESVTTAARALAEEGAVAGQRVLIEADQSLAAVCGWFGALRAGVMAVPINPGLTDEELVRVNRHSGAVFLVSDRERDLAGVRRVPFARLAHARGEVEVIPPQDGEAIAAIVYTSGTSGQPRGAMLSHRALVAHCEASWNHGITRPGAVVLECLPLFHVFGLNAVLGAALHAGSTVVLVEGLREDLPAIIRAERVTHVPLTPSALYRLTLAPDIAGAFESVQLVTSGAAPLPGALATHWLRLTGIPVQQGYGLTEAAPGVATTVGVEWQGPNHVGVPLPGVEIRIGDGSDPIEPGEVWIRGRNLFSGYWPDGAEGPDADGWFATGDIGYQTGADLFLIDRSREVIIVSGFNVYPAEIEEVLEEHPDVDSAAVVGQPDEQTGERVVAFVTGESVSSAGVLAYATSRLARYKRPSELLVIKVMPRSPSGKIRKTLLRDLLDRTDEDDL